jgi:hypothetical protein
MIIKECNGNEERKQRQANQPNTQKKAKQTGRKKSNEERKENNLVYICRLWSHLSHFLIFFFKAG